MINVTIETLLVLALIAFVLGLIVGVSLTRPVSR